MTIAAGSSLSHYRLVEKLGEGGTGAVWRAVDTLLDREVAVKIFPGAFVEDRERLRRIEQEAKALAALSHPNIVTIHSVEEASGVRFITMELVRGKPLAELLHEGCLLPGTLIELAKSVADAINAAHERGLTHRDLKPGNIMVTTDGRVKVLDFGLARSPVREAPADAADDQTMTQSEGLHVSGTLPYMSPEQVQGRPLDHRSDIFSLGVILYEMATGRRPFRGQSRAELIASILRDVPPPITDLNRSLPRQLDRIVRHSLEKHPKRRFQTALDLRNELDELQQEISQGGSRRSSRDLADVDRTSIAVLPLNNLSQDPSQEFFVDGMTDALINNLARIAALKVISRTSAMQYKGASKPLLDIARELNVASVVEGSVLRVGDRVRITAQLIDAVADENRWAESYERDVGDVLALQAEVAQTVAREIEVQLTPQELTHLESAGVVDPEAHEACLRGRFFWYKRSPETVRQGLECFQRAVQHDPGYAPAYAGIADSYIVDGGRFLGVPPKVAYGRAREAALKALELDELLAEAHTSLAAVYTDYDWNWSEAERAYRRAIELNPGYVTAHSWFAEHLSRMGRHDEAIAEARRGRELDPLSLIANVIVAWILFFARRYDQAIVEAGRILQMDPDYPAAHRILGWVCEETGRVDEAIAAHRRAATLSRGSPNFRGQLGRVYALAGRRDEAVKILDELLELSERTHISPLDIALIHLALDNRDDALNWLTRAVDERCDHLPYLQVNPRLDALRPDPRFQQLLRRMGLGS